MERDEIKAKMDLQVLIEKQFALRRKSSCQGSVDASARYSRVRAADSTGLKVNGLTVSVCLFLFETYILTWKVITTKLAINNALLLLLLWCSDHNKTMKVVNPLFT
jgi:hypothetical protein